MVSIITTMLAAPVAHAQTDAKRIVELESFRGFAGLFNLGQGAVRAVALVRTSSDGSAERLDAFYKLVSEFETNRFRAYVLFIGGETSVFRVELGTTGYDYAWIAAVKAADRANLSYLYKTIIRYQVKYKTLPRGTGRRFVVDP